MVAAAILIAGVRHPGQQMVVGNGIDRPRRDDIPIQVEIQDVPGRIKRIGDLYDAVIAGVGD